MSKNKNLAPLVEVIPSEETIQPFFERTLANVRDDVSGINGDSHH
jgi:3-hydroxyacyl-CoA dehydrogenase